MNKLTFEEIKTSSAKRFSDLELREHYQDNKDKIQEEYDNWENNNRTSDEFLYDD